MAITNFIASVWSARLQAALQKALVFSSPQVANKDYEGEICELGDRVKINFIGDVTVGDYTKNTNISDPETLSDSQKELLINQAKFFNFQVDDIDKAQAAGAIMPKAMERAAYAVADIQDQYVAALHTAAPAGNLIGDSTTPVVPTSSTAYNYLVDASVLLDESNTPKFGRWIVVPSWFHGLLLKDDRFVKSGTDKGDQTLVQGMVGMAAGFMIFVSNNVVNTTGTKYKIMAGYGETISVAEQIISVEAYRPEKRFADAIKGLAVFGAKVVRPETLVVLTADKA